MVSLMLYPCTLCVALLMNLFVLCVTCFTVFVNCLAKHVECNVVSNECNEPAPCFVQYIATHGCEVMYLGVFALGVSLVF